MYINWQQLVTQVEEGRLEICDKNGQLLSIYHPQKSTFLSHPKILYSIQQARKSNESFMLNGPIGTGKHSIFELIAQGCTEYGGAISCADENISAQKTEDELLHYFFGIDGVVDRNRGALIGFDFIENAKDKSELLRRIHELALHKRFYRMDHTVIENYDCRVCIGTTEMERVLRQNNSPDFLYLISHFKKQPIVQSISLNKQVLEPGRLASILAEQVASKVLKGVLTKHKAEYLSCISDDDFAVLETHYWENEFPELSSYVEHSVSLESWTKSLDYLNHDSKMWDVFISHASEDKDDFVRPLADALSRIGLRVWYDETALEIGDSLIDSIDHGLVNSRYGIIVLSEAFFKKPWTNYEYKTLATIEREKAVLGQKVILPIWHNVTKEQIARYSTILVDKVALNSGMSMDQIVEKIGSVVCRSKQ